MRAVLVKDFGPIANLKIHDVPLPQPGPGQLRIAVKAAGIGFVDALIVQGKYQVKPPTPFAPCGEYAGVVDAVGEGVTAFKAGDRVLAGGFMGGLSEYAIAPAAAAYPIPGAMSFEQGAMFRTNYATALHALRDRGDIQPGETLLVLGAAGGTGSAAIEVGKILGARVIAAASSDEKRQAAIAAGADEAVDYTDPAWRDCLKALTADKGVDVVFDPVGGPATETAFRSLAWKGRHLVIGFAAGDIPKLPINLALLKGASLVGVDIARFGNLHEPEKAAANVRELLSWFADGRLALQPGRVLAFEDFAQGFNAMIGRSAIGKIVVRVSP